MNNRLQFIKPFKTKKGVRYYKNLKYPPIPLSVNDIYVLTVIGDRLDLLARQFYGSVDLWWVISLANMEKIKRDSFALKPGIEIRIPTNIRHVQKQFEKLNDNLDKKY